MKSLFFVILLTIFTVAQNRIENFNIIIGKWKLDSKNFIQYEEWEKINDTTFTGIGYSIEDDKKNILERLYLLKLNDHFVYIAQPGNNNPTLFTLINSERNKFIFENKEHDFPQKIIYYFKSVTSLNASIEGDVNGNLKRKEFHFEKIE